MHLVEVEERLRRPAGRCEDMGDTLALDKIEHHVAGPGSVHDVEKRHAVAVQPDLHAKRLEVGEPEVVHELLPARVVPAVLERQVMDVVERVVQVSDPAREVPVGARRRGPERVEVGILRERNVCLCLHDRPVVLELPVIVDPHEHKPLAVARAREGTRAGDLVHQHRGPVLAHPVAKIAQVELALRRQLVGAQDDHHGLHRRQPDFQVAARELRRDAYAEVLVAAGLHLEVVVPLGCNDLLVAVLARGPCVAVPAFAKAVLPASPMPRTKLAPLHQVPGFVVHARRADGRDPQVVPEEHVECNDEVALYGQHGFQILGREVPHVEEAEDAALWAQGLRDDVMVAHCVLTPLAEG
mmetsp:Transcript_122175/g.346348  ORF Transcript_122175/g.346348 Transcript_122175/m.346348 type:complete len:355 (+) Transcript_122175:418-1482(+)